MTRSCPVLETPLLRCTRCRHHKSLEAYYVATLNVRRHRRHSWCKLCFAQASVEDQKARPDVHRKRARDGRRRQKLRMFGLTEESFAELSARQGDVCAICSKPEPTQAKLVMDHDHATGQFRGLLCSLCNPAIGLMRDEPETLRAAADYLERFHQRS